MMLRTVGGRVLKLERAKMLAALAARQSPRRMLADMPGDQLVPPRPPSQPVPSQVRRWLPMQGWRGEGRRALTTRVPLSGSRTLL